MAGRGPGAGRRALAQALGVLCGLAWLLGGCQRREATPPTPAAAAPRIVIESAEPKPARHVAPGGERAGLKLVSGATPAEIGIGFYPGATVISSELIREHNHLTAGAKLTTRDPYEQVVAYYSSRYRSPGLKTRVTSDKDGKTTWLNWRDSEGNYAVALRRDDPRKQTIITLARLKGPGVVRPHWGAPTPTKQ